MSCADAHLSMRPRKRPMAHPIFQSAFGPTCQRSLAETCQRMAVRLCSVCFPPKADISGRWTNVRFVPSTDSCTAANSIVILSPHRRGQTTLTNRDFCAVATPARWACQSLDDKRIAKRIRDYLHKGNTMPRTKVSVPDVAEVAPGLWSNAIRAGDMLFIYGQ